MSSPFKIILEFDDLISAEAGSVLAVSIRSTGLEQNAEDLAGILGVSMAQALVLHVKTYLPTGDAGASRLAFLRFIDDVWCNSAEPLSLGTLMQGEVPEA